MGRLVYEPPCDMRSEFVRDRDRIIHCMAFRRLKHKTQVFMAPEGDHFVTRLTHTLEVSQIARTIARALNLNEDLAEAISLGHDLGHTPFGHIGESALGIALGQNFRHNEQSLRVVDLLENEGKGLNLTLETRDGILHHSKIRGDLTTAQSQDAQTLEGQICKIADAVAYINHDIADAIRAGIIQETDLPSNCIHVLGSSHSQRIDTLVKDIVQYSWAATGLIGTECLPTIGMSPSVSQAANELREFLFDRVYIRDDHHADYYMRVVLNLYRYFLSHSHLIPTVYFKHTPDDIKRITADYIAGMTDQYALRFHKELKL